MSRATVSKSRADKKGPSAPTPAIQHEIVPGKFNDQDWNLMLERDDSNEYVSDMLDEILTRSMNVIYEKYIEEQLLPYTISQARDALLMIIEWQFLARDDGETNPETDRNWQQDEEPEPAETDCWAQGSVPKHYVITSRSPSVASIKEETIVPEDEDVQTSPTEEPSEVDNYTAIFDQARDANIQGQMAKETKMKQDESEVQPQKLVEKEKPKEKIKFKPHKGRLASAGVTRMTESLEHTESEMRMSEVMEHYKYHAQSQNIPKEFLQMPSSCHSILKMQTGRPPGTRDVQYDEFGNVVAVVKLNPERLPSHRVRTKFHIVDPSVEEAQARLEAMRTGRYLSQKKTQQKPAEAPTPASRAPTQGTLKTGTVRTISTSRLHQEHNKDNVIPLPPPLLEQMEVAPGVVVKEGNRVKRGPKQRPRQIDTLPASENLRPVAARKTMPVYTVKDIIERQTPVLRPLNDSPPIPPIVPHPPSRPRLTT